MADQSKLDPRETVLGSKNADQLAEENIEIINNGPFSGVGIGCTNLDEPIPEYIQADCEVVYKNRNNSYIVLGRDRPGSRFSGYAGQCGFAYNCGMIDLVVGRGGPNPKNFDENGEQLWVDSNFTLDSARIYIGQTTDIDTNFGISENVEKNSLGMVPFSTGKSGIGIKADHVRVIAREHIKLVTYTDYHNSRGQVIEKKGRISLVANNDDSALQPMVKGRALIDFLVILVDEIRLIKDTINNFYTAQNELNKAVAKHTHMSPYYGQETNSSGDTRTQGSKTEVDQFSTVAQNIKAIESNLTGLEASYIGTRGNGESALLSSYCFLN